MKEEEEEEKRFFSSFALFEEKYKDSDDQIPWPTHIV